MQRALMNAQAAQTSDLLDRDGLGVPTMLLSLSVDLKESLDLLVDQFSVRENLIHQNGLFQIDLLNPIAAVEIAWCCWCPSGAAELRLAAGDGFTFFGHLHLLGRSFLPRASI